MAGEPEIHAGESGEWVGYASQLLTQLYGTPVTDTYDDAMVEAVTRFRGEHGPDGDGSTVDEATWQSLRGLVEGVTDEGSESEGGEREGEEATAAEGKASLAFYDVDVLGVWVSITSAGGTIKADSKQLTLQLYTAGNEQLGSSDHPAPMNDVEDGGTGLVSVSIPDAEPGEGYIAYVQLEDESIYVTLNRTEDGSWVSAG